MSLRSRLFKGDAKLEAAAVSNAAHIARGASGPHVAKIQTALNILDDAGLDTDGIYGAMTAAAVLDYKQARNIINPSYETQADDIVGIMTMAALDNEMVRRGEPIVVIGQIVHSAPANGRSDLVTATTTSTTVPVTSIRAVVRNNPYTPTGVNPPVELPSSVPPSKTYAVQITVEPPLTGSDFLDVSIVNANASNGTATVAPSQIQRTSTVIVTGVAQTQPRNGGKLQIQAALAGQVLATSEGFTVCAHPRNYSDRIFRDVNGPSPVVDKVGMIVAVTIESDSGTFSDLNECEASELIETFNRDIPPFKEAPESPSGYTPIIPPPGTLMGDTHAEPRPLKGPHGIADKIQMHIFKCHRCGAEDKAVPNSGFDIQHEVFQDQRTKVWKHKVTKTGQDIGMFLPGSRNVIKTKAGVGNITSPIHNL